MNTPIKEKSTGKSNTLRYVILALACSLLALYFLSPVIIGKLATHQLQRYGISTDIAIQAPRFNHIKISQAEITSNNPDIPINATLRNIEIHYNLWKLLSSQTIQTLNIGSASIDFTPNASFFSSKENTTDAKPIDLTSALPSELFTLIPASYISIKDLNLHWQYSPTLLLALKGQLNLESQKLNVALQYFEEHRPTAHINAQISNTNTFSISLLENKKNNSEQHNQITISGSALLANNQLQIKTETDINLAHFETDSVWLPERLPELLKDSELSFNIKKHATLPTNFTDFDSLLAKSSTVSHFDYELASTAIKKFNNSDIAIAKATAKGKGQSQFKDKNLSISLLPNSEFHLQDINSPQISAVNINLKLDTPITATLPLQPNTSSSQLKLNNFSTSLSSSSLSTQAGSITHQPIALSFSNIDSSKQSLTIDYTTQSLSLNNEAAKLNLPFATLDSVLSGTLTLNSESIKNTINKKSLINIHKIFLPEATTEQISISNNTPLVINFDRKNQQFSLDDQTITIQPAVWSSQYGALTHQEIALDLSEINLAQKSAKLYIDKLSLALLAKRLPFKTLALETKFQAAIDQKRISITLPKGLEIELKKLANAGARTNKVKIKSTSEINLSLKTKALTESLDIAQHVNITPFKLLISGSKLSYEKHQVSYRSALINLKHITLSPLRIQADTHLRNTSVYNVPLVKNINIYASHDISQYQHKINANIKGSEIPFNIKAQIQSRKKYKKSHATWQLNPIDLSDHSKAIADALQMTLPTELSVIAGSYQQSGELKIDRGQLAATIKHRIKDLAITHQDTSIEGINSASKSIFSHNKLIQTGHLKVSTINNAVPITNISADFKINDLLSNNTKLKLSKTTAQALDASLKLDDFTITLKPLSGSSVIHFSKLPLNNILALEQQPSLVGTGTLAGKLPFSFKGDKIWIKDGDVYSTDNGYIRYSANDKVRAFAKTNTGLAIALNVLEDFHYQDLSIDANYSPDGKLVLRNKLAGKNPNWQEGQPIEFAINIEENVLQLLKTLQFSDQLEEKIQQQLEKNTP